MKGKCIICENDLPEINKDDSGHYFPYFVCSTDCGVSSKELVESKAREISPELYRAKDNGEVCILDPYVGDEYSISRLSLESRIKTSLTRQLRLENLKFNCNKFDIDEKYAWDLLLMAEKSAGSNYIDIELCDRFFTVYETGGIKESSLLSQYGFWWKWVENLNGWVEIRKDHYRSFRESPLKPSTYGDTDTTLSVFEHGMVALNPDLIIEEPSFEIMDAIVENSITEWREALEAETRGSKEKFREAVKDLDNSGYMWDWDIVERDSLKKFVNGGTNHYDSFRVDIGKAISGETIYVHYFGNAAILYGPRSVIEKSWMMNQAKLNVTKEEADEFVEKYGGCAGREFYRFVSKLVVN